MSEIHLKTKRRTVTLIFLPKTFATPVIGATRTQNERAVRQVSAAWRGTEWKTSWRTLNEWRNVAFLNPEEKNSRFKRWTRSTPSPLRTSCIFQGSSNFCKSHWLPPSRPNTVRSADSSTKEETLDTNDHPVIPVNAYSYFVSTLSVNGVFENDVAVALFALKA